MDDILDKLRTIKVMFKEPYAPTERIIAPTFLDQRTKTKCQNRPRSPEEKRFRVTITRSGNRGVHTEATPCTVKGNREKRREKERKEEERKGTRILCVSWCTISRQTDNVLVHVYRRYIFI